jgi:hypothetical protein
MPDSPARLPPCAAAKPPPPKGAKAPYVPIPIPATTDVARKPVTETPYTANPNYKVRAGAQRQAAPCQPNDLRGELPAQ